MPVRIGFSRFRRQSLEAELERITAMLPQLGVDKAFLIGDLAKDNVGPQTTLDLVMVLDLPGSFARRSDFFASHLGPMVGSNFFVYTPEEFETLRETSAFLRSALQKGRLIHES
jgi:hypothetical protein